MIPYDELVAALASWRQRQGLQAGPSDYLGEPVQPRYDDDYAANASAAGGGYGEDVVELSDDMMDSVMEEQSNPYSVEAVETADEGGYETDTQDQDYESAMPVEPPKPEPEPEPEPTGRRKRKR